MPPMGISSHREYTEKSTVYSFSIFLFSEAAFSYDAA
jgi:hypothetical protein